MSSVTKVYANTLALFEASRLDDERLRRVVEAEDLPTALKMLGDYGFPTADGTVDGFIIAATNELIDFVCEYASSDSVKQALLAPFWYNNVKLAYKSRFISVPADGYYKCEYDAQKIADGNYEDCDKALTAALEKLDEAEEKRPNVIDLELTRAMYKQLTGCSVKSIRDYFKAEVDLKNILTAARMIRMGLNGDEFVDGGRIKRAVLENALTDGFEVFAGTPYAELAEEAEADEFKDLWKFERRSDGYLLGLTEKFCADIGSYVPFLNYYAKTRIELKNIKTALVCIKSNARDEFYKRYDI